MLAALASIPEDERQGMELDVEVLRSKPVEERLVELQRLWTVRQQELREAYDAMPKVNEVLTERLDILKDAGTTENILIGTLADLEDLLLDIDMARDFHTIGGFPILVSMLRESQPEGVREMAAWAIGTAVKNEAEHQLWVLEVSHWSNRRGHKQWVLVFSALVRNQERHPSSSALFGNWPCKSRGTEEMCLHLS